MPRKPIEKRLSSIENDMALIRREVQSMNGNADPIDFDLSPCEATEKASKGDAEDG